MMPPPSFRRFSRRASTIVLALSLVTVWLTSRSDIQPASAQGNTPTFKNFESPQVHPLALTPDGTRLLAVNSPHGTLSVFQLVGGTPQLTAEIPVGLEPVSVAARNNREAWVVNWLSDSVSIVDLATGNVTRTIDVGDEPTDIIFAGLNREMAFVCVSGGGSLLTGTTLDRLGRGQVKVFDPSNPTAAPQTIEIFGKQPRALARSANGAQVYVSIFESGNQTTIVPESVVKSNGGLPPPSIPLGPGLPAPPSTSLIVKWNGSSWVDELNRSWNSQLPYTLADIDVAVINATGTTLPNTTTGAVRGLGTHMGNMAFDPATSRLFVTSMDSTNEVRFEPVVKGKFQSSRVVVLNAPAGGTPTQSGTVDLNQHVNLANPAGTDEERAQSLAMPSDIVRAADGTIYVAALSSGRVGVLAPTGVVTGRIGVGQGPTGLALDETRSKLYVLNRFDQTISLVDTNSKTQTGQIPVGFNPEPAAVRNGRRFLYGAEFSAHGTVSCASCHLNGHRDGLAWDLGNPQGSLDRVTVTFPPLTATEDLHPMKGPMVTQSLRDIMNNTPLHWRGDRQNLAAFNGAFTSLLGGPRQLTAEEMAAFEAFTRTLVYPPNPHEIQTRPPVEQRPGFSFFSLERLDGNVINCSECHTVTNFRPGTNNTITPALAMQTAQSVKVPQLRGLYQKTGLGKTPGEKLAGFGFSHDGSFDTLFNFQRSPVFTGFSKVDPATADSWRRDMERMILELDTGTPPVVGLQVTVNSENKTTGAVTNRINLLAQQAQAGNCDLVVRGIYGGIPRSFQFIGGGQFQPDSLSEANVTTQTLLNAAGTGSELTFTAVPAGSGRRFSIDSNGDGVLNDDGPRTSVQLSGRVVNASGTGIGGVTVALSGSQTATTVTDAQGRYSFNFVSTTGSYTVTPASGATTFEPANRTFTNPTWNQTATFVAPPGNVASDSSAFFVTQHYADFLNREPDASGLQFWTNQIEECRQPGATCNVDVRRINASAAFYLSIEFQQTGFLVYRATVASFGRMPRYAEFFPDTQRVARNVIVGVGDWQGQLERNKVAFFNGWVQRPEFLAQFPASMSPTEFVDRLRTTAGIQPGEIDGGGLANDLAAGRKTRAEIVRAVSENTAFVTREKNRAFVLMQYFGYLRRNPEDPPEPTLDLQGFNFWLGKLDQFGGNFVDAEMVKAFIISGEYKQRFGGR